LRENGRRSNVEIARLLGLSEGTVRKRIEKLLAEGNLCIVGLVDPQAVGYPLRALIALTVALPQLEPVSQRVCALPEVLRVYHVTGEYDLLVEGAFTDEPHLLAFLTERLATIPGVLNSKVSHVARILKEPHAWALPQPPPAKILIVDDDPDFVEITRMTLEREGYRTCTAASGKAALDCLRREQPDLVILDVMMDGVLDGWDAGRKMRNLPGLGSVPILVVSSITASDYLSLVPTDEDNLIDNFLAKPVDPQRLLAEVKRLLRRRG